MTQWFMDTVGSLAQYPAFQGLLAALSTFVLEDPTTIGCGLLVADGKLSFLPALIGVSLGIAIGDLGLFAIGRFIGPRTLAWGLLSQARIDRARGMFDRNLVAAVVVSRFLPGMRVPTYMGAGIFGASAIRFLVVAVLASLVWTFLLLSATLKFGEAVLPMLGQFKWPAVFAFLTTFFLVRYSLSRRQKEEVVGAEGPSSVSTFELWPPTLFYLPVAIYYGYLCFRFRGLTLPTVANPSVYASGVIGESKSQILDLVPPELRESVCPYVTLCRSDIDTRELVDRAVVALREKELSFPVVAKPDRGQRGDGVRLVQDLGELELYLQHFPVGERLMLQAYADFPCEAGILYYRFPAHQTGSIFSITLKDFPVIIGDGVRCLRDLILADPRARFFSEVYFRRHTSDLDRVLPAGEELQLVFSGNHCQGAIFRDGGHLLTPELFSVIDRFFSSLPEFYFGRLDVRFKSMQDLAQGRDLLIVEINGAGAEATHIWDREMRLVDAYRVLFRQFEILFHIGSVNRHRGFKPVGPVQFLRDFWAYVKLSRLYPETL